MAIGKTAQDVHAVITDCDDAEAGLSEPVEGLLQLHELGFTVGSPVGGTMKKNHRAVRSLDIFETTPHTVLISGCKHRDPFTDLRSGGHVGVGAGDISEDVFSQDRKRTDGQQHDWEEAADALNEYFNHLIDAVLYHKRNRGRTEVLARVIRVQVTALPGLPLLRILRFDPIYSLDFYVFRPSAGYGSLR